MTKISIFPKFHTILLFCVCLDCFKAQHSQINTVIHVVGAARSRADKLSLAVNSVLEQSFAFWDVDRALNNTQIIRLWFGSLFPVLRLHR